MIKNNDVITIDIKERRIDVDLPTSEIEKRLKKWNRAWKLKLIEEQNPNWRDLSEDLHK